MQDKFQRTLRAIRRLTRIEFINWVQDRITLLAQFIRLGNRGRFTRAQLIEIFSKFMLAIAERIPESWPDIIIAALIRVRRLNRSGSVV